MNILLDILLILILAFSIFAAVKKGFVKSVIGLAGIILAVIIAVSLSPKLGAAIDKGIVKPMIRESIVNTFSKTLANETEEKLDEETKLTDTKINGILNDSNSPQFVKDMLHTLNLSVENAREELTESLTGPKAQATVGNFVEKLIDKSGISRMISNAIAFIIIFIVIIILTKVAEIFAGALTKLPILKQSDKLLGVIVGLVKGLIAVFVFCLVVRGFSGLLTPADTTFEEGVLNKTIVFKLFYNFNPFQGLKF